MVGKKRSNPVERPGTPAGYLAGRARLDAKNSAATFLYLDDSHVEAGLLSQLLPDVSRGFGGGSERRFQRLQLLGLDGGARAAPLPSEVLVIVLVINRFFVGQSGYLCVLQDHVVL